MRNSGDREYGAIPESFMVDDDNGIEDEDAEAGPPTSDSTAVCDSVESVTAVSDSAAVYDAAESVTAVSTVHVRPADGGRDLDLKTRDVIGFTEMVEGRLVGTDVRRSALKGAGGTMAKGGTKLGSNGRPELDPSPSL